MSEISIVKHTFECLIRHRPDLKQRPEESPAAWRDRGLHTVAHEWGFSPKSMSSLFNRARSPKYEKHGRLFDDVRKYGGAKIDANGRVDKSSLNKGPEPLTFLRRHRLDKTDGNGKGAASTAV